MVYHYLLMSRVDFLKIQSIEEILRERAGYYKLENNHQNYWIIIDPLFIKDNKIYEMITKTKFYSQNKEKSSYVALVSTSETFINWLQLRIGYFESIIENQTYEKENSVKLIKSDGIKGRIEITSRDAFSFLTSTQNVTSIIKHLLSIF